MRHKMTRTFLDYLRNSIGIRSFFSYKTYFANSLLFLLFINASIFSQTIAEKKASLGQTRPDLSQEAQKSLVQVNREMVEYQEELRQLSQIAMELYDNQVEDEQYELLLNRIQEIRQRILDIQENWRLMAIQGSKQEPYALWHQPEITLEQLVNDYGSQDYVYIMSAEIAGLHLSVDSNLPIPRTSWNEMLELILSQNGIGIKQLNPYLRQLYFMKQDNSGLNLITNDPNDLELYPNTVRAAFVITPDPAEVRRTAVFLENFTNPANTIIQVIGRDIIIVAQIGEIQDLLKLYEFMLDSTGKKEYRAIVLEKIDAEEMAKVLSAIFDYQPERKEVKQGRSLISEEALGLKIATMKSFPKVLFLIGTPQEICRAESIIQELEDQISEVREKTIFLYTTKHTDPEELAQVLQKIYELMIATNTGVNPEGFPPIPGSIPQNPTGVNANGQPTFGMEAPPQLPQSETNVPGQLLLPQTLYPIGLNYSPDTFPINVPPVLQANPREQRVRKERDNFIVDPKTSSIVMVVETDLLPKMKELIAKLDVPKKMVQLEVLLFEKRMNNTDNYGINLLRLGDGIAKNKDKAGVTFNQPLHSGIFDFIWSRTASSSFPAFDLIYQFLLTQEDITINTAPSVVTVNQTPAFISIQEEISVNTGVFQVETAKGVTLENAFARSQYGTTIKITPTIHMRDSDDPESYNTITLVSEVNFDTIVADEHNRPNVIRRNIQNEARIADGQTVILGGLRRKNMEDTKSYIPFIGEIPGIGKLFSHTSLRDQSTEMFIFITPKIIDDPACDFDQLRYEEMLRRPGDIPEFMCCLVAAREWEQNRLFKMWLETLFGREPDRCYTPDWQKGGCAQVRGEYDGR